MKICFIAAGPLSWASSRYRAYWVAEALRDLGHDAQAVQPKDAYIPSSDIYIWQKIADTEIIRSAPNARHYWDLCDPSWWWQPKECEEIAKEMNGFVFSTQALADDFVDQYDIDKMFGHDESTHTFHIPDRFKLSHFHTKRQHTAVSPVRFIWYGIAANRVALWAAKANLERLVANGYKIELTIFDDRPDVPFHFSDAFPIYHTQWTLESEVAVISSHDIALLPPYPGEWGRVKSNNKAITANLCGLCVYDGNNYGYVETLVDNVRARQWERRFDDLCDIKQSALDWLRILE